MKKSATPRVAVFTDRNDAHLRFVERHLDAPMLVIDPRELLEKKELTYKFSNGKMTITWGGFNLGEIKGVWYRKPRDIEQEDLPVSKDFAYYSQTAMQRHGTALLAALKDATWVSDYYSVLHANHKPLQLAIAAELGFNVPDTVVTSDSEIARKFIQSNKRCVTKPITIAYPTLEGDQKVFFTSLIDKDNPPDLTNLYLAPAIFQEAIDIEYDIRVTVVGDKVFAASVVVEGLDPASRISDSRVGNYEGKLIIKALDDFPKEVARLCIEHVKALGLKFGAIDLLLDKRGKYWFLENNPNGQWAYVEDETGQPIGKALADLLQGKNP